VDTARLDRIADLQRRIALADRLDQMSGIHTMQPDEPQLPAVIREERPFDFTGRPHNPADEIVDAEFELVPNRAPDAAPAAAAAPQASPARPNWWRRIGGLAGAAIATGLGYSASRGVTEPTVPPGGYGGGTGGMYPPGDGGGYPPYLPAEKPRTAAERIRLLQMPMRLNPNTQVIQNWTQ
jgi:hypothetical protein